MAKERSQVKQRSVSYRLSEPMLDRLDSFVEAFAAKYGLRTTATEVVTKAITEYLDRREPEVAPRKPTK